MVDNLTVIVDGYQHLPVSIFMSNLAIFVVKCRVTSRSCRAAVTKLNTLKERSWKLFVLYFLIEMSIEAKFVQFDFMF